MGGELTASLRPAHPLAHKVCPAHRIKTTNGRLYRSSIKSRATDNKQHGWNFPWSLKRGESDTEYETVYVTDSGAEEDEVQQLGVQEQQQQQQQQPAAAAAVADVGLSSPDEDVPEVLTEAVGAAQQHTASAAPPASQAPQPPAAAQPSIAVLAAPHSSAAVLSPAPVPAGFWESSAGGWVIAMALLVAVRQGRLAADAGRLDVKALQARQEGSRVQSRELREKRAQYLQQQAALKEAEAAKRLAESARRAELDRQEAAAKAAEYERAALQELAALRARRAAAKKAFEESQGRLDEELAARTARELALREEDAARRAAEEEAARAAATAEAARVAAEAQRAAEEVQRAAREAAEQHIAAKQQMRRDSIRVELQLRGRAVAAGSSSSRQMSVSVGLFQQSGSSVASSSRSYESPDAVIEGATQLAAAAAQAAANFCAAAVADTSSNSSSSLEGLTIVLPGQQQQQASDAVFGVADLLLWRWLTCLKLEGAARQAVGQVAPLAGSGELQQDFQAYIRYSGLPQQNPCALQQRLQQAADLIAQEQVAEATALLNDMIEWHLEDFVAAKPRDKFSFSSPSSASSAGSNLRVLFGEVIAAGAAAAPASAYLVPACIYALLLNTADEATKQLNARSSSSSGGSTDASRSGSRNDNTTPASPMDSGAADDELFDAVEAAGSGGSGSSSSSRHRSIVSSRDSPLQRLVKFQLEQLTSDAPQDSLASVAASLQVLLGHWHPVAAAMQLLAERNTSLAVRQAREMRRQQKQLARATEVLKGSAVAGPGGLDPQGAWQRQALVPVPERTWALRNVANSMLRSTAGSGDTAAAAEALGMLKQAADLAAEHYGNKHPGQLSTLLDYTFALLAVPGHTAEAAAAIEAACGIVAAVGERYRQQQDLLSLVLLYESTQAELDVPGVLSRDNALMRRLERQAADAFSVLETAQANLVMSKRKLQPGSPATALRQLARDCTEELGVYSSSRRRMTRLEQWNKNLPLTPLR